MQRKSEIDRRCGTWLISVGNELDRRGFAHLIFFQCFSHRLFRAAREEIIALSIAHSIVTELTSFVAVEEREVSLFFALEC